MLNYKHKNFCESGMNTTIDERHSQDYSFDVAISFAGAERPYARVISKILADNNLRVFLDEDYTSELWGTNLVERLSDIYEYKARYCIVIISKEYCEKLYTNIERRSALDRAIQSKVEYIPPLKVDDAWIQGLSKSTAYLDLRNRSIISVCEEIYRKVRGKLPAEGLSIPEDINFQALELGQPSVTDREKFELLSAIRDCFDQYRKALLNDDGVAAVNLVSQSTIEYYARIRDLCLYGSANDVRNLSILDQMIVLILRHHLEAEELLSMSASDLFVWAIENGLTGKSDLSGLRIKHVRIADQNLAVAEIASGNQSLGFQFRFVNEKGQWRLDMLSFMNVAEISYRYKLEQEGLSEFEFLSRIIEPLTGKKLTENSWKPLMD